jgi:hypothetical protein
VGAGHAGERKACNRRLFYTWHIPYKTPGKPSYPSKHNLVIMTGKIEFLQITGYISSYTFTRNSNDTSSKKGRFKISQ